MASFEMHNPFFFFSIFSLDSEINAENVSVIKYLPWDKNILHEVTTYCNEPPKVSHLNEFLLLNTLIPSNKFFCHLTLLQMFSLSPCVKNYLH